MVVADDRSVGARSDDTSMSLFASPPQGTLSPGGGPAASPIGPRRTGLGQRRGSGVGVGSISDDFAVTASDVTFTKDNPSSFADAPTLGALLLSSFCGMLGCGIPEACRLLGPGSMEAFVDMVHAASSTQRQAERLEHWLGLLAHRSSTLLTLLQREVPAAKQSNALTFILNRVVEFGMATRVGLARAGLRALDQLSMFIAGCEDGDPPSVAWRWLSSGHQGHRSGLQALIAISKRHEELRDEAMAVILRLTGQDHASALFHDLLRGVVSNSTEYLRLIHCSLQVLSGAEEDAVLGPILRSKLALSALFSELSRCTDPSAEPVEVRCLAFAAIAELWVSIGAVLLRQRRPQEEGASLVPSLLRHSLARLTQGARQLDVSSRLASVSALYRVLRVLQDEGADAAMMRSGMRAATFLLVEHGENELLREHIVSGLNSLIEADHQRGSLPLKDIVVQVLKRERPGLGDLTFMLAVAKHPNLEIGDAVSMLDALAVTCMECLPLSRAALLPALILMKRFGCRGGMGYAVLRLGTSAIKIIHVGLRDSGDVKSPYRAAAILAAEAMAKVLAMRIPEVSAHLHGLFAAEAGRVATTDAVPRLFCRLADMCVTHADVGSASTAARRPGCGVRWKDEQSIIGAGHRELSSRGHPQAASLRWRAVIDKESGDTYYYRGNEVTWDAPAGFVDNTPPEEWPPKPATSDKKSVWRSLSDPESGEVYFWCTTTGEVTWDRPDAGLDEDVYPCILSAGTDEWEVHVDRQTGFQYFVSLTTGTCTWKRPLASATGMREVPGIERRRASLVYVV